VSILVAYASKHGATQGIAERIAAALEAAGRPAQALPVSAVTDIASYGSARPKATRWVSRGA
jgi:menaquinone-dependent protoporphyrinogen oxidase